MSFDTELLRRRVERLEGLPTLPSVASHLLSLTQSPQTSATEIGEIISQDQALTARVLKLVNSAYYGFPRQITTVNHAVVILGFKTIRNLAQQAQSGTEDAEKRLVSHLKKRQATETQQIARARELILPLGRPQERVLTVAPWLARYGPALLRELLGVISAWYAAGLDAPARSR